MVLNSKNLIYHVLFCIGFLFIPCLFLVGEMLSFHDPFHNPFSLYTIIMYTLMLVFYYVHFYYLIPAYYIHKKYLEYVLMLALIFFLFLLIFFLFNLHEFHLRLSAREHAIEEMSEQVKHIRDEPHRGHPKFRHAPPIVEISRLIFLYLIGIFVGLYLKVKQNLQIIESEKRHAELAYLKSQMNPHFLFNTFNTIYSLAIREKADDTANGMLKLSGMMRYIVSESLSEYVLLEKELSYINDFIELQKLRLDKAIQFKYNLQGDPAEFEIAPYMLIPFIENAFKHGVNPDEDSDISIQIKIKGTELFLDVVNKKVNVYHTLNEKLGFGIENTKTRLTLLYPNAHTIHIEETAATYSLHLKINLI